ncbi:MAG: dTDP-4-dehydrorhamnose reductase [Methylococcaceae bacterium TMED69]|nr:MAG: dTDP-4-dehydrorhamnose reductase [Methylococcaceae bacterium TMED69]|tara:strand:+ start:952 stop:1851 length:900 start_codon:yes stop_codon:yes gene_type:complete
MKLLLLGANGQLGQELRRALPEVGEVKACDRYEVDLTDTQSVLLALETFNPDIVINAAAYTAVDKAETNCIQAFSVNADAVRFLANEVEKRGIWLIHYSTDYIFDGRKDDAYRETDPTNPVNVYGESKLAGEQAVIAKGSKYLIFRTSWVIGKDGNNFAKTILKLASGHDTLNVINDQIGVPTSPALISKVTVSAINAIKNGDAWLVGIYHLAPKGKTTWFGVAEVLLDIATNSNIELSTRTTQIKATITAEYPTAAKRPLNSCLNTDKLAEYLSFELPHWKDDFFVTAKSIIKEFKAV